MPMRRPILVTLLSLLSLLVLACGVVAVVCCLAPSDTPPEPSYQGQSLTYWLDVSDLEYRQRKDGTPPDTEAFQALRHIGTNAVPTLLKWVEENPLVYPQTSPGRLQPPATALRSGALIGTVLKSIVRTQKRPVRTHNTDLAFLVLGTNAQCAIPALVQLMNDPSVHYENSWAASALGHLGPAAYPPLLAAATNPLAKCRGWAIIALGSNSPIHLVTNAPPK